MSTEAFIEVVRKGGATARIRADFITALIEMEIKEGDNGKFKDIVQIHLGANSYIAVQDDSIDEIWNKMCQAMGRKLHYVAEVAPDYPGHPNYKG